MNHFTWIISSLFICFNLFFTLAHASKQTYFSIMSFNIENGGTQVDFNQVVKAIKQAKADVVCIQEAWGNSKRLAKALNWNYYDPCQHVISRFPLFKAPSQGSYVLIEIKPKQFIAISNIHLPDELYGPELIEQGFSENKVRAHETGIRLSEAKPVILHLSSLAKQAIPVFLTGDFNSPSHLDWTEATLNKVRNHRYLMHWPVTQYAAHEGFIDSYRQIYPDPFKYPGFTWPAKRPHLKKVIDGYNPSNQDLPDRIDFIFFSGPATALDSHIVGEQTTNPWPSDHRAVVSHFKVIPSDYPIQHMQLIPISGEYQNKKPKISVPHTLFVGEPIQIAWQNAPGYSYDYISISRANNNDLTQTVRLYTQGKINGVINYTQKNVTGNRIHWYKTPDAHWPLSPGVYNVQLMLDDGLTSLASAKMILLGRGTTSLALS